jgi:hypothetical protein
MFEGRIDAFGPAYHLGKAVAWMNAECKYSFISVLGIQELR